MMRFFARLKEAWRLLKLKRRVRSEVKTIPGGGLNSHSISNWGTKKQHQFNVLVNSGTSVNDAYIAVEHNKGLIDV